LIASIIHRASQKEIHKTNAAPLYHANNLLVGWQNKHDMSRISLYKVESAGEIAQQATRILEEHFSPVAQW